MTLTSTCVAFSACMEFADFYKSQWKQDEKDRCEMTQTWVSLSKWIRAQSLCYKNTVLEKPADLWHYLKQPNSDGVEKYPSFSVLAADNMFEKYANMLLRFYLKKDVSIDMELRLTSCQDQFIYVKLNGDDFDWTKFGFNNPIFEKGDLVFRVYGDSISPSYAYSCYWNKDFFRGMVTYFNLMDDDDESSTLEWLDQLIYFAGIESKDIDNFEFPCEDHRFKQNLASWNRATEPFFEKSLIHKVESKRKLETLDFMQRMADLELSQQFSQLSTVNNDEFTIENALGRCAIVDNDNDYFYRPLHAIESSFVLKINQKEYRCRFELEQEFAYDVDPESYPGRILLQDLTSGSEFVGTASANIEFDQLTKFLKEIGYKGTPSNFIIDLSRQLIDKLPTYDILTSYSKTPYEIEPLIDYLEQKEN